MSPQIKCLLKAILASLIIGSVVGLVMMFSGMVNSGALVAISCGGLAGIPGFFLSAQLAFKEQEKEQQKQATNHPTNERISKGVKIVLCLLVAGILLIPVALFGAYAYHDHKNAKLVSLAGSKSHVDEVIQLFGKPYDVHKDDKPPSDWFQQSYGFELGPTEHAYQFYPTSKWRPCYMIFVITDQSGKVLRAQGYQP